MRKKKRRTSSENAAPAVEDPASDAESFGPWLRRQREGRGIDLREIADESKISVRYLEALETNRFEALPAAIFTKGFLRQYASYVGLDAEEVVNYFLAAEAAIKEKSQDELPEELRIEKRPPRHPGPVFVVTALIVVSLMVALLWWLADQNKRGGDPATQGSTPSAERPAPSKQPGEAAIAADGLGGDEAVTSGETEAEPTQPSQTGEPDPAATLDAGDPAAETPSSEAPASPAASAAAVEPAGTESRPRPRSSGAPVSVIVDFTGDCWVEASVDGRPTIAEMRVQGESLLLEGQSTVELKVGDINVVRVEVNGRPWSDPSTSTSSVRQLRFDRESLATDGSGASE